MNLRESVIDKSMFIVIHLMENKGMDIIKTNSEQATCGLCGLTARTGLELADHVRHAHGDSNSSKRVSAE
jgi:hypothetical protein